MHNDRMFKVFEIILISEPLRASENVGIGYEKNLSFEFSNGNRNTATINPPTF